MKDKGFDLVDAASLPKTEFIPTGFEELDAVIKGLPRKRITEIYGPPSVAKSTLALATVAHLPKGSTALYVDVENALDAEWVQAMGIKKGQMTLASPLVLEDAAELVISMIGKFDLIIFDSIAMVLFRSEQEKDMGEYHVGIKARLMTQFIRKLLPVLGKSKTAMLFINQERDVIGDMYGPKRYTPGGKAVEYAASMRIRLTSNKSDRIVVKGDKIGKTVTAELTKNKVGIPEKTATFTIYYDGKGRENSDV
jgi:recombination protein RecA